MMMYVLFPVHLLEIPVHTQNSSNATTHTNFTFQYNSSKF